MVNVFIVASNHLLREALLRLFRKRVDLNVVGSEKFSSLTLGAIREVRPDVLLMDSTGAELSGIEFVQQAHREFPTLKIAVFGMNEDEEEFLSVVRSGAVAYLLREASAADLVSAIRAVMAGEAVVPGKFTSALLRLATAPTVGQQLPKIALEDQAPLHVPTVEILEFSEHLLSSLRADSAEIYKLTDEQFERLVCDRLRAMGMGAERVGSVYSSDGGIDIVAWPDSPAAFPFLLAVQAKCHRDKSRKTGPAAVLELQSVVRNLPFQAGMLVTNTTFTPNAKWVASNRPHLVRLRDHADLRRWIMGEFLDDTEWREIPDFVEYAPGRKLWIPRKK
jgi:DNA-binding NarL/FixJ family response regulator